MNSIVRILHLEDDQADARLVHEHLRRAGIVCEVTLVDDRDLFESTLSTGDFDLVLADFNLPAFSGLHALEIARSRCPDKPFIFVSGAVGEERAVDLLRNGATDFVWKDRLGRLAPVVGRAIVEARERIGRQLAEAALRESETRFKLAQAGGGIGVWEWDANDGVTYWSDTMWNLYGLEPTQNRASIQEQWLRCLHAEDREPLLQRIEQFLASAETEIREEFRIVRQDESVRWMEANAKLERDPTGKPSRMLGVNIDISGRKESELALREADRRKDEFLATLAHELRNPLAPILNSLNILRITNDAGPPTTHIYEMMDRQVKHMVRLVDDLLEVSRITRGKIELRKELIEISSAVRSAIETSKPLIDAGAHDLIVTLPSVPLTVEADPVRLSQVIANLLNNAAKYTKAGGKIWLTVQQEYDKLAISVRDNGIGIPEQLLPHIFKMFTQVDRDHKGSQGGLGIGLALVTALVEMHGGKVKAESCGVGEGSTFTIRLPLATVAMPSPPSVGNGTDSKTAAPCRVLVVDDNQDAAYSLGMLLKVQGSDVHIVNDGLSAIDALTTYRPSVVLLDIGMPGLSGYEVARRIRGKPEFVDVTLIAVTGWAQEEDRMRTREAGFQHHLVKPVDSAMLQALLAELVANKS